MGFIPVTELGVGWVALQKQENHSVGVFFPFYFKVRKQLIDAREGIHFGGVVSLRRLPEFRSRSSRLGALR